MTMTLAIKVLNMIKDDYSMNWDDARIANHKGIPLTSRRWVYTNPYYSINPYLNGRETGFAIEVSGGKIHGSKIEERADSKIVIFSEHRSSDALVVYVGLNSDFDTDQLNPHYIFKSERRYRENATFFNQDKLDKAVEFIEKELFDIQIEENEDVWKEDKELRLNEHICKNPLVKK